MNELHLRGVLVKMVSRPGLEPGTIALKVRLWGY